MGNVDTKLNFRKAVVQLSSHADPIDSADDAFWSQFWCESNTNIQDIFTLMPGAEIRALRADGPANLGTLCYKAVQKVIEAVETSCRTQQEQQTVLNCVRLLTRLLPYIFEDPEWRDFFWSSIPSTQDSSGGVQEADDHTAPLAHSLLTALADLLFCPDFTIVGGRRAGIASVATPLDKAEDLSSIDSCEHIWEAGVGVAASPPHVPQYDANRTEILKLLLTCFSETMYQQSPNEPALRPNKWIMYFTSAHNRHVLPVFTSLLNTVCAYDPIGMGVPYNHLLFNDSLEPLVETALQILIVTLDHDTTAHHYAPTSTASDALDDDLCSTQDNLFITYLSRIHRDDDFHFMMSGLTRLLNNPLMQTYLPNSAKKVHFHQELLVFLWKMCDYNKKFLGFVLKSSDVLDVLVPILYHLNDSRADQSRVGLMHIGVFILLLLSGERNFGVRLNKPYTATTPMDIPVFAGTHADLLIIVFHKIITTGHQRLQPLFDCLLTILVNVSPYLKTMSMVASTKLLHLLEAFSTPWFLFSNAVNHHLVFFLLEIFNNIVQYQFDGNSNLVYTIIRKRHVFHRLINLPTDGPAINKSLHLHTICKPTTGTDQSTADANSIGNDVTSNSSSSTTEQTIPERLRVSCSGMESIVAEQVEGDKDSSLPPPPSPPPLPPSTMLNASLAKTPHIAHMTEHETAHPTEDGATPTQDTILAAAVDVRMESPQAFDMGQMMESMYDSSSSSPSTTAHSSTTSSPASSCGTYTTSKRQSVKLRNSLRVSSCLKQTNADSPCEKFNVGRTHHDGTLTDEGTTNWSPTAEWVRSWKAKLPLQTIMRMLQVLVPQVEKICIEKGLTDETEILKFLQHGTLVGLLPVPHPILIRKYQPNAGTTTWFRTYMWGVIYLRNVDPPIWYDTDVKLFEIQRV